MEDRLLLRYKITGQGGNELINTLNLSKDALLTAKGDVLLKAGEPLEQYHFIYFGEDSECGQEGDLVIRPTDNENQIELILSPAGDLIDYSDCLNGEAIDQLFPTNDWMTLTKQ